MAINNANLTFNGVTDAGGGYASFNGRYQWDYTDTSQTLLQLDNEEGTGIVVEKLRFGDLVQVTASDGVGLFVVQKSGTSVFLNIVSSAAPNAGFWI